MTIICENVGKHCTIINSKSIQHIMNLKIRYKEINSKSNKKLSLFYIIGGVVLLSISLFFTDNYNLLLSQSIALIFYGIIFYSINKLTIRKGYATLKGDELRINQLFGKKINLTNVDSIRRFASDFIFKNRNTEILILDTQKCNSEDLQLLMKEIDTKNIMWK